MYFRLYDLQSDVIAGLSVALTVIPQGLAYANIAGLPSQVSTTEKKNISLDIADVYTKYPSYLFHLSHVIGFLTRSDTNQAV